MNAEQIEDQKYYLRVWREVLFELLGYTPKQIDEWIKSNRGSWETSHAIYVSDFPEAWVVDALISQNVREKIGAAESAKLERDIVHAIEVGEPKWSKNQAYDWAAARQRIKKVFATYGVLSDYQGLS